MAIDNIKIAEALKKLQEDILGVLEEQAKSQKSQLEIAKELVGAVSQLGSTSGDTVGNIQKTQESLEKAAEAAQKMATGGAMGTFSGAIAKAAEKGNSLRDSLKAGLRVLPAFGAFVGMWDGFANGIGATVNALKLFGSFSLNALESLGQLAVGILAFPFRLLSNLIDFASAGGGDNSLRQALEDIRKEFGDLRKTAGAAIIEIARNMQGTLANTGLSVYRTFGRLAERLKTIAEYAKNLGPLFSALSGQFIENAESVGAYFKALGLSEEGQRAVASRAFATGQDITEVSRQLANYSVQLADQFGLSAKEISRDVGNMMADFEHFGGMAPQVLSQISVYARRLGVDVKGLLGIIDRFDNFEDAARSAAQLTQAFGLQLDALQLMKAQDPAERTEMLRKSFFAAGRSIENMTRQERALLQQQTGLEASTLDLVFSQKNQSLSYEQVKKKSDAAHKSQLTQTEAMQKLAGAIERLVRSGSTGGGGFFERFFQGFERGIRMSADFRRLMIDIRMALRATYWAGAQVGRMFVQMFPGVQQLIKGLDGLFNRERFRKMLGDLKGIFRSFFTDLTSPNSKDSFKNLMENLKTMFWNYFDGSSEAGRGILDGLRSFSKAVATIFAGLIREAMNGLTQGVRYITDILSGRKSLNLTGGEGAWGFVMEIIGPIIEAIKEAGPPLLEALKDLWTEEVWPRLSDFLWSNAGYIAAVLFGPALLNSLIQGVGGALASAFTGAVVEGAKGLISSTATKAVSGAMSTVMEGAINPNTLSGASEGLKAASSVNAASMSFGVAEAAALGLRLTAIAGALAVGGVLLAGAIYLMSHILASANQEQIYNSFAVMGIAIFGMVGVSLAVKALEATVPITALGTAIAGIIAVMALTTAMALNFVLISNIMRNVTTQAATAVAIGIGAMTLVYLAGAGVFALAAGIGASIASTGGTVILAGIAGMATLALVISAMAEHGMVIMRELNNFHPGPGLEEKAKVFASVIETITDFASVFSDIISTGGPSVIDLIQNPFFSGNPRDRVNETYGQITEIIQVMGGTIQNITNMIVTHMRNIGRSASAIKGAAAIGGALEAVTALAMALRPPENFNEGFAGTFFPNNVLLGIEIYMRSVGPILGDLIPTVTGLMMVISSIPTGLVDSEKIKTFSIFMEGIGTLLSALSPSGGMGAVLGGLAAADAGTSFFTAGMADANNVSDFLTGIANFASEMIKGIIGSGLFGKIGELVTGIAGALKGLDEQQIKGLDAIGGILTSVLGVVGSFSERMQTLPETLGTFREGGGNISELLDFMKNSMTNMLVPMTIFLPPMIDALINLFISKNLKGGQLDTITKGIEAIKGVFEVVGQIPGVVEAFQESNSGGQGAISNIPAVLSEMQRIVSQVFVPGGPLSTIFTALNDPSVFPTMRKGITENFNTLKGSLTALTEISQMEGLRNIGPNLAGIATSIGDVSKAHIGESIKAMVQEVNSIAHDIGAIEPINISTRLKGLAGRLGLGSDAEFTIQNRDFNIEVNLEVHVDARELETVLVDRPNTRILHKARATR